MACRRLVGTLVRAWPLALVTACGDGPTQPSPSPAAPQISCPAPVVVENVANGSQAVSYPAPTITGGAPPVTSGCAPASGASFGLGDTAVECAATDSLARRATCSFVVTLQPRRYGPTKYLAFGDSQTAGENGRPFGFMPFVDTANAYPTFLQQMFAANAPSQSIAVVNAGLPGERVTENDARLKGEIDAHDPQVLLLLEGINDLIGGRSPNAVVNALRDNIAKAKERGVQYVLVSTLLPVAPENCGTPPPNCRGTFTSNATITTTNQSIRSMVPATGAYLVEGFDAINANRAVYVDVDGLHLRPEGNRALATAFWTRIGDVVPAAAASHVRQP